MIRFKEHVQELGGSQKTPSGLLPVCDMPTFACIFIKQKKNNFEIDKGTVKYSNSKRVFVW